MEVELSAAPSSPRVMMCRYGMGVRRRKERRRGRKERRRGGEEERRRRLTEETGCDEGRFVGVCLRRLNLVQVGATLVFFSCLIELYRAGYIYNQATGKCCKFTLFQDPSNVCFEKSTQTRLTCARELT